MGYASCLHLQGSEERLEFFFASRENVKIDKPFLTPVSVQARPVGILPERPIPSVRQFRFCQDIPDPNRMLLVSILEIEVICPSGGVQDGFASSSRSRRISNSLRTSA